MSDVTDNRQILDELSRRRLISLFQDHDFPIVVRALREQEVADLAIFLLVLTRTKTNIPTLSETEETSNDLLLVDRAAQILANLPTDQQTSVAQEIAAIDMLPTEQIKENTDFSWRRVLSLNMNPGKGNPNPDLGAEKPVLGVG